MNKVRFALIGCGRIGERHAQHINEKGILKAVCDIDLIKAEKVAKKYHVTSYTNIDTLLEEEGEIDVVSICTPNGLHVEHSIAALKVRKNVLCEKPMAINVSDCSFYKKFN